MKSQVNLLVWILSLTLYCTIHFLNETLRPFNLWEHYCNHTLLYLIHMDVFHCAKTIEILHKTSWTILLLHTFTFHWRSIFSLVMNKEVCKGKELWIALSSRLCHVQPVCWLACVGHYPSLFMQYHFLLTFTGGSDLNIEGNALKGTSVRACFLCSGLHCVLQIKCELSLGEFPCFRNPPELCDMGQCQYYKCASKNCRHIYTVCMSCLCSCAIDPSGSTYTTQIKW